MSPRPSTRKNVQIPDVYLRMLEGEAARLQWTLPAVIRDAIYFYCAQKRLGENRPAQQQPLAHVRKAKSNVE